MGRLVIQSIWLAMVVVILPFLVYSFSYIIAPILGLIPFLYLKKSLKKDILKVNVLSSVVAFVVLIIAYILLGQLSEYIVSEAANLNEGVVGILSMMDISGFLSRGAISLGLFNIPFLLYFLFEKKKGVEVREELVVR